MVPAEHATRIHLLGRFVVEVEGQVVPASAWTKRRPIEVLVALALAAGRVLHREELIDRLWPEKDLDAGANNLHRALHDLRRVTGTDIATLDRGVARLSEAVWVDVDAFERAAASDRREDLMRAVELYRGPLLPDDPYADTIAARREALRQRFVDTGLRLARLDRGAREPEACVATLRRMLELDPALEPAHQLLMRVLAETGRTGDALRQFAECTSALGAKLDTPPSRETFELRAEIERGAIAAPRVAPTAVADVTRRLVGAASSRRIHGRGDALVSAQRFVEGARGVLLVVGEAGLGKTRLVGECARWATAAGAVVLAGLGLDQDSGVPYAPFADAWAHHRRTTNASVEHDPFLSFSPSGGSAQEDRLRLFHAVERSVEIFGGQAPVCIVIENLHQADPSSLLLFHHLARATRARPLMLIGTLREEETRVGRPVHTLLASLRREHLATRIELRRLDLEATTELVAELWHGDLPSDAAAAVFALAEGNPFHTEEVVHAMLEEGTTEPRIPANLLDTIRHRLHRLGRDAERLLAAAAVVGVHFPFEVARRASGLEPEPALDALERGVEARLVEEEGSEYRFRHALTRQALLDSLTSARRAYLHGAVADALEGLDVPREDRAELLAFHHEAAGHIARALPCLLAAGERSQTRLGFSEAVTFYGKALAMMDQLGRADGAQRFDVLRRMGGMRMALSDLDGAVRDLDAAASLAGADFRPSATQTALVKRVAALALIQGGHLDEAGKRLDDAVIALAKSDDDPELPAVLYLFSQLRWHEERFADAKALASQSLKEAEARGDRRAMAKGHEMLALACHSLGTWQEGHAHEEERQALSDGTLDVDQAFDVHLCLWEYHLYGDHGAAQIRHTVDQTLLQAQRMKAPRAVALCENFSGTLDFQGGRWVAAEKQLRQAVDRFREVGSASGEALSLQRLGVLLTARGAIEESRTLLDEGLAVGGRAAMRSHCLTRIHASLARNRLAAGDREGARQSLEEGLAEAARHGHCATCGALLLPEAVRVSLAWGDVDAAELYAKRLEDVARRFASRAWTAMADQTRGRVIAARGDADAAFEAFERAREAFEAIGAPYEAGRCVMAQSRLFVSAKGKARARKLAEQAESVFATLGAAPLET